MLIIGHFIMNFLRICQVFVPDVVDECLYWLPNQLLMKLQLSQLTRSHETQSTKLIQNLKPLQLFLQDA